MSSARSHPVDIVGSGWSFPLGFDRSGSIALVTGDEEIEQSIRLILGTVPGERPMRPEFGCRAGEEVFSPADATTAGRIAFHVRQALDRWEPRIEVLDIKVGFDHVESGVLYLQIDYRLRTTHDPRALVLPFYVIPADDAAPRSS